MGEAKRRGTKEERIKNADFRCIICRRLEKTLERSDEHVIPDSLNGYYHIYNVCKSCNSNMGVTVDGSLINHKLAEFYRFSEQISGKSGKIPNPFKDVTSIIGEPDSSIKTDISKNGQLVYKYLPKTKLEIENGTLKSFQISVDVSDEQKLDSIRKKIIRRNNLKDIDLGNKSYVRKVIENPILHGQWEIDIVKFRLGLLKIAYEFAVDSIDNYFDDPLAIKISEILRDGDYKRVDELKIGSGFDKKLFESVGKVFDINKKRHILMLFSIDQGLVCFIKLDELFHIGVLLSQKKFMPFDKSIIGINDLKTRKFAKRTFIELMNEASGLTQTRLGYWVSNDLEFLSEFYEPKKSDFQYQVNSKGEPQLYKKNGKLHQLTWQSLLLKEKVEIRFEENSYIQHFTFRDDLELFVKSVQTGKLYEIRNFELSREFTKI